MVEWVLRTIESTGYIGIVLLMFLENVFPPIPSELIMPLAGFMVAKNERALSGVVLAGTIGSVIGALPFYYAGYSIGEQRLEQWIGKYGRWLTVSPEDLERARQWFEKRGRLAVFVCRLVPGLRSLISIPAGIARMPLGSFLFYTAMGALFWTAILAYAGYLLAEKFREVEKYLNPISYVVLLTIAAIYIKRLLSTRKGTSRSRHTE
jgi:membrane protein DedA with SNARE-associated domain